MGRRGGGEGREELIKSALGHSSHHLILQRAPENKLNPRT